ncbi:MAG: LysM peptidoglycan-binding domain-containing protein [Verrucomicrobiae bacterium]|nr:LysM peptidoglycan-binding domain-containing protein [Verrucomicrobiae bacterium]
MARLKMLLAFFALVVLAAGALGVAIYWKKYFRPNWEATREFESGKTAAHRADLPDLGIREFEAAEALLIDGELQAARDRLHYLLEYYPDSKAAPQAKEIIGEINMDLLLSRTPIPGKEEHVVQRGDFLAPIARKYQTSINYIMRAGGRMDPTIYPGDRLVVYPLNFQVRISLGKKTITILTPDEGKFFKEYEIRNVNLPARLKPPASTKIEDMVAWNDGKLVGFDSSHYFEATKWIRTGLIGLFIRQEGSQSSGSGEDSTPFGVTVDKADLEEMFAYLRHSNPVTLVP